MRRPGLILGLALLLAGTAASSAAQTSERVLHLQFDADGRVTLRAEHVTPREILAEWARLCGCHLVNAAGLRGEPLDVPLLFERQSQSAVLNSLLRQAAGYILTPRRPGSAGPSEFETIYIVPVSTPTASPMAAAPPPMPMTVPIATPGVPDNEIPPVQAITPPAAGAPTTGTPGAKPAGPAYPGSGLPGVVVPIIPLPSSPFMNPTPNRSGGPGQPTTPAPGTPGQAPAQQPQPGGTVGANP